MTSSARPSRSQGSSVAELRLGHAVLATPQRKKAPDHRERAYAPRGLRRAAAADWVGMSPTKFDQLVAEGLMPRGRLVRGCRVWDRYELDIAFENLPDEDETVAVVPAASGWDSVA
ncbi:MULTISPECIES: hypothetical protein [unclassified Bradyrhizobium]|uniref:hypothetical protein n=1 Tax=unclassified Bradyrhizobium TaxID=2631580 RepID=UPI0028E2F4A3|nr:MULTISPECIES: hypothetical protein [unclassified Bradyrhizobium]